MRWSSLMQDHLEISIVLSGLNPLFLHGQGPILETAELVFHDAFYDRIEIAHIADPATRRAFARRAEMSKVNRTFLAQPTVFVERLNMHSADRAERERALRRLSDCLNEAAEIGADMLAFCSGPAMDIDPAEGLAYCAEGIAALHEQAVALDIRILLEPFDEQLDKKRFIGTTDRVTGLMQSLPSSLTHFAVLADLSHFPLLGEEIRTSVNRLAPYLGHVHIGNGVVDRQDGRFGDSHPYFGYPGGCHDTAEVAEFISALIGAGYLSADRKRTLGIEIIPAADEAARDVLAGAKRTLRAAWFQAIAAEQGEGLM